MGLSEEVIQKQAEAQIKRGKSTGSVSMVGTDSIYQVKISRYKNGIK